MVASDVCDEGFGCLLSSRGSSGSSSGTLLYQNSVERVQAVAHLAATTASVGRLICIMWNMSPRFLLLVCARAGDRNGSRC